MLTRTIRSKVRCGSGRLAVTGTGHGNFLRVSLIGADSQNRIVTRHKSRFAYPEGMKAYEDNWTEEPEYPKIDPETHHWNLHRRERLQKTLDWHQKIKNASCPEAKNLELNMPWQYGYRVFYAREELFDYNCLSGYKYITRTHVASNNQLPSQYSSPELNEKVEYFKEKVRQPLLDALTFELDMSRSFEKDFNEFPNTIDLKKSRSIITQINRVILSVLGREVGHLQDCQVDVQPNLEAFWTVGGTEPPAGVRNKRKGTLDIKGRTRMQHKKEDSPIESNIYYVGDALLQIRCKDPPQNFAESSDKLCQRSMDEFPDRYPHFLQSFGLKRADDCRFASIIPGHWTGDDYRCNLIAFHGRHHLLVDERASNKYWSTKEEQEEALLSQAMLVSFSRLVGQALYHGFDQFVDLVYPFSTQTIITNGLDWSFFAYQMNTMQFNELAISKNQKQNIIWGTQTQSIFDTEKKGELNDEVLSNILRFYLNPPQPIQAENPTPYLSERLQDWENERERILLWFNLRLQIAQVNYEEDSLLWKRPPEMYEWERIYKFLHDTLPMEKRALKWWELPNGFPGSNPWTEPYKMIDPLRERSGVRRLREEVAARKEKERLEAAKAEDGRKYGINVDSHKRK